VFLLKELYDLVITGIGFDYLTVEDPSNEGVAVEFKFPYPNPITSKVRIGEKFTVGFEYDEKEKRTDKTSEKLG
jgi:non-canonical (house-cleaning) NTP pyrophosphatase